MTSYRFTPLEVFVDERAIFHSEPAMAFVANVPEYGTGFPLAPDARPDDGMLDVCVIPIGSPVEAVRTFLQAAAGEHVLAEGVVYARGKQIEIRAPQPVPIQVDGDPAGFTPAHIHLLPVQVPFVVPG
jgi:diacylglycerol kinase family enzyme